MSALKSPVTGQEVADLMTMIIVEIVAVLEPDTSVADVKLEDLASNLLTLSGRLRDQGDRRLSAFIRTTAQQLIQTETGAA